MGLYSSALKVAGSALKQQTLRRLVARVRRFVADANAAERAFIKPADT